MRLFKTLAAVCCVAVCALTMTSCEGEDTITKVYSVGISEYYSQSSGFGTSDLVKIQDYLDSKNLPYESGKNVLTIMGSSVEKCDKQAKAQWDEWAKKLSYSEVAALGLTDSCRFTYSLRRLVDDRNPESERLYIGKFTYPQQ